MNNAQIARQLELLNIAIAENDNGQYDRYIALTLEYLRDHGIAIQITPVG